MTLIAVEGGHGRSTAGKRTPKFEDGTQIREWEFNYPTSKKLGELLEYNGFNILYVSSSEEDTPLKTRTDLANKNNADLYISIHYNALAETWRNGVGGIETYHHTNSYKSKTIAETVHKHLINDTDMKDRGVKSANFHVLRETKMPSILCEMGFMDILDESLLMLDEDYQWKCAKAIAKGVCEYYGVEYKEPKPTLYRIRKSWEDVKSQIGAYNNLDNAKILADKNSGYNIYDENGALVYPERREIMQLTYTRILKKGLRGEDIKNLQIALNTLGYDIGKSGADGIAGSMTDVAIRQFQRDNKLKVDGLVGRATIAKINELLLSGNAKPSIQNSHKYYKSGITHVVEVDPLDLKISVQDKSGSKINLPNFVTSGYQWHHPNGETYPLGILVSEGKIISNTQPHGKPAGTLIVYEDGTVKVKELLSITGEKNVWFAVSGCGVLPTINMTSAGFVGAYSDIGRSTNRPLIGYNPTKKKIVIAVRSACSINTGQTVLRNLGCSIGISLDAGGSTLLKVDGKLLQSTTRRLYSVITW